MKEIWTCLKEMALAAGKAKPEALTIAQQGKELLIIIPQSGDRFPASR
jgi:hypothetical protein